MYQDVLTPPESTEEMSSLHSLSSFESLSRDPSPTVNGPPRRRRSRSSSMNVVSSMKNSNNSNSTNSTALLVPVRNRSNSVL